MRLGIAILIGLSFVFACKEDKTSTTTEMVVSTSQKEQKEKMPEAISQELYASLDRLRIRVDSSMDANTVVTISERDTLQFLKKFSSKRMAMKLRGKYYYEPWLKVKHNKSGKVGWVYGGAVSYDSKELKDSILSQAPIMKEIYADDMEWEGTVPTAWSTATISSPEAFKIFLINFKEMVQHDEVNKIADLIRFPIKNIQNRQQFRDNYSRVFSEEIKEAVRIQRLDRIFRNSGGASIGDGELWFHQVGEDFKIVTINFKGRDDLRNELMQRLSNSYHASSSGSPFEIKAFKIRNFLELTLNYSRLGSGQQSKSLGKYTYDSSMNNMHTFNQDTQDSLKRRLVFRERDGLLSLQVLGGEEPQLDGVDFVVGN